jgi:hypothetical protein
MALSNAERQRLYIQRLKERAAANTTAKASVGARTKSALNHKAVREASAKKRHERWAERLADWGWRVGIENLLHTYAKVHGVNEAKKQAWKLFGMRWKP